MKSLSKVIDEINAFDDDEEKLVKDVLSAIIADLEDYEKGLFGLSVIKKLLKEQRERLR